MPFGIKELDAREFMLEKIRCSGLNAADAKQLGFQPCTAEQCAKLKLATDTPGAGFKIPYYAADGHELPMFRYRFAQPLMSGHRLMRYTQPKDSPPAVYLPRLKGVSWPTIQANPELPLVITEGELKAACATKAGLQCIGLGGVWNFASKKYDVEFLPQLEEFVWSGRTVTICYDSDAAYNTAVQQACNRLARVLAARGADVRIATIPQPKTIDGNAPVKVGLDDLMVVNGQPTRSAIDAVFADAASWAEQEELFKLNTEAAMIRSPHCVAIFPQEDAPVAERGKFLLKSVEQFYQQFAPRKIMVLNAAGEPVPKSAAKIWFESAFRREHYGIVYKPGAPEVTDNQLNLWPGWPNEPRPGNVKPWLDLLDRLFTKDEQAERRYFTQWLAYPIQHPGAKLNVACLLWSTTEGNGKSTVGYTMRRIYGGNNSSAPTQSDLERDFNGWQENKQLICGEEITGNNARKYVDKLKHMITSNTITVNRKGVEAYEYPNLANILFTSNNANALYITEESRRYFIHEVKNGKMPTEWWPVYRKWLEDDGGAAHLHQWFLDLDLTGFSPHSPAPVTKSFTEMTVEGYSAVELWCHDLRQSMDDTLKSGTDPKTPTIPYKLYTTRDLIQIAKASGRFTEFDKVLTEKSLGHALRKFHFKQCNNANAVVVSMNGGRSRVWAIRSAADCELGSAAGEAYMAERGFIKVGEKSKFSSKRAPKFKGVGR